MVLATLIVGANVANQFASRGDAASMTGVSVTLSNTRPSFVGTTASGNSTGGTIVNISTSSVPSPNTHGLLADDIIAIGVSSSNSFLPYTINEVTDADTVGLNSTPTLTSMTSAAGRDVISTQSASLTVRFTPVSTTNGGSFRVLVPAASSGNADGKPDQGYWDYGTTNPTVTCAQTGTTFGASTASSGQSVAGGTYHAYGCPWSTSTNSTNQATVTVPTVINPPPASGHTVGTADSYKIIVQHLDGSNNVIDQTTVAVGLIESVRVTATVAPQISFSIASQASALTRCNVATTITTSAAAVPFGDLTGVAPAVGAHLLSVTTNAANGYAVTVRENDQLGLDSKTCTTDGSGDNECINDASGAGSMSHTASDEWSAATSSNTEYGFGYSLQSNTGSPTLAFAHNASGGGSCGTNTNCWKHFADAQASEVTQQIASNSSPTGNDAFYVCYKVNVPATQVAGNYDNNLTYVATATF